MIEWHADQKSLLPGYAGAFPFPYFPPPAQFVAAGLNKRISFFGSICNGQAVVTPLIVYIPNHFINFATNTSTFTPTYSVADQISFFNNGFAIATQNQSPSWSSCLACAVIDTAVKRSGGVRTDQCQSCFTKYCYTGKAWAHLTIIMYVTRLYFFILVMIVFVSLVCQYLWNLFCWWEVVWTWVTAKTRQKKKKKKNEIFFFDVVSTYDPFNSDKSWFRSFNFSDQSSLRTGMTQSWWRRSKPNLVPVAKIKPFFSLFF